MSIDKQQLRDFITRTLKKVPGFYSEDAVELMMITTAAESESGKYLYQLGGGPAKGLMQVESATMKDNYKSYLFFRPKLFYKIYQACGVSKPDADALEYNMAFNVLMARLKYWRNKKPIPKTLEGKARYHADVYNTDGEWEDTLSDYYRSLG